MLKMLSGESKTFSELAKLTDLRGENLLFYLQKLLETGMILCEMSGETISLPGKVTPPCRDFPESILKLRMNNKRKL